jgi:DNA-binding Lrp family transcriptional regulator
LDSLDIKLVRELSQGRNVGLVWGDINPAYRDMAHRLGVSKETVRERVEKMLSSGFLKVFPVQVNPGLLGLTMGATAVDFPASASKAELFSKLTLLDGLVLIAAHVTPCFGIVYYFEDEASRMKKVELISRICSATATDSTTVPFPRCTVSLSELDWKIIAALQQDRRGRQGGVAQRLGISEKTLQRRVKKMVDGWAISTMVSADVSLLRSGVLANLMVHYTSTKERHATDGKLLRDLDEYLFFLGLWTDFSLYSFILPSISEAMRILERTKATPGVASARIELVEQRVETYDVLREQVERKLRSLHAP